MAEKRGTEKREKRKKTSIWLPSQVSSLGAHGLDNHLASHELWEFTSLNAPQGRWPVGTPSPVCGCYRG